MRDIVFELAYLGSESFHLPGESDQNTVVPSFVNGQPFFPAGGPRANVNFASITRFLFDTTANYNALQVTLRRKSSTGLQYQASYTYSKTIDGKTGLTNGDAGQEPEDMQNPFNPGADHGLSLLDARHNFVVTTSYPFPFHFQQKPAEMFLGGWIINGIGTFRSGEPFTATAGFNVSRSGDVNIPDRPNLVAGRSNSPVRGGPDKYYDPTAFVLQSPGTYGNLGRNTVIGPGIADVDLSLQKNFRVRESLNVQFRGEFVKFLNHATMPILDFLRRQFLLRPVRLVAAPAESPPQPRVPDKFNWD